MNMDHTESGNCVRQLLAISTGSLYEKCVTLLRSVVPVGQLLVIVSVLALLFISAYLRFELERRSVAGVSPTEKLRWLPKGEFLKPMLLGHAELGADLVWLQFVQVVGSDNIGEQDFESMRHALDVVTTLDPHFLQAYDFGGVILAELGKRVDWSNALLEKGMTANPQAWRLPFLLGFNHFFYLHDYGRAAMFLSKAARLGGAPPYVPELAARLYVEADSPEIALVFLETMQRESRDSSLAAALERRRKEVIIERDIMRIEQSLSDHMAVYGSLPSSLEQLVERGFLRSIPVEPFDGFYRFDSRTGLVTSTTHPQRLRIYGQGHRQQVARWGPPR
jgi:hypothetical protein